MIYPAFFWNSQFDRIFNISKLIVGCYRYSDGYYFFIYIIWESVLAARRHYVRQVLSGETPFWAKYLGIEYRWEDGDVSETLRPSSV